MILGGALPATSIHQALTMHATFQGDCGLLHTSRRRIAVVGKGNIGVGSKTSTHESIVERLVSSGGATDRRLDQSSSKRKRAKECGAMSEQGADGGRNEQVPQKLVHLVGYRDPNARPDPWIRPRPVPVER
ncbi:hypothetical protein [Bradyrhizobium sp.]|jgi:hypothetical protein|uniref:hypothetical protein n=1 Tax=Bradyrhizobium sp. TaxID=376 RepID=UPI002DFE9DCC|nr:hypothetical protein [Bradyrhizobium sp.]